MPSTAGYDAFISYSRRQDGWLAPALQGGLERFAKPWYRVRGLRVFRDKASLAASPELWGSIEAALRDSRWLVLLSSREAAQSSWVDREVAWWLANKSADHILVVATSDRLRWDKQAGDWAEGAPVPPSLRGAFRAEPLWADLTGVHAGRRGVRVPDEDLASMAAPLRGVDRDTLIGEHLRQHRRTMRVVRSVIASLTVLLVFAVAASVIAVGQRDDARTQARIATARELAALSGSMVGSNLDVARLLAVGSYQLDRDPQTEAAVWQAAAASPQLVRFLQAGSSPVNALASSADGTTIVAGTDNGDLVAFDLATGRRTTVHATSGAVTQLSVSADGHAVAAMNASQVVTWTPGAPRVVHVGGVRAPDYVAVSPSGGQTAVLEGYGSGRVPESLVVRAADGSERTISVTPIPGVNASATFDSVGFPSDSSIVLVSSLGQWRRLDTVSLRATAQSDGGKAPGATSQVTAMAENGAYAGFWAGSTMTIWPTSGTGQPGTFLHSTVPGGSSNVLAIQPDGQEAAVAQSSTIDVVPLFASGSSQSGAPIQLTGSSNTSLISFLGNGGELASAAGSVISVWNPGQTSRLGTPTGFAVPSSIAVAAPPPVLLSSPDGTWISLVDGDNSGAWIITPGHAEEQAAKQVVNGEWDLPIRNGDTPLLIGMDPVGLVLGDADGTVVRTLPAPPVDRVTTVPPSPIAAGMLPGGKEFALVGSDGSVQVYDIPAGTMRQVVRAEVTSSGNMTFVFPLDAAISPDGTAAAIAEWVALGAGGFASPSVRYVDLRTGRSHPVGSGGAASVEFTPDGLVIQRLTGTIEVWDQSGEKLLRTLPGTGGTTSAMAVSPDGTLLARLRNDGTISLTDLTTGDVVGTFSLPSPEGSATNWTHTDIAFTANGSLLTATPGDQLISWTVDPPDLVRSICATAGGTLTDAQWHQYAGTSPPAVLPCAP